jgi:dTDP-4-dehydrorhamnose reductase
MDLFVTGISGRLGLNVALQKRDRYKVSGCYHRHAVTLNNVVTQKLDLTSFESTLGVLREILPVLIIHAAALTNMDECEADAVSAYRVNVEATSHIARAAEELRAKLVHISTDNLFDGTMPWKREEDSPSPLSVYSRTKLQAEEAVVGLCPDALIIRTNLFGWGTSLNATFSDWVLDLLEHGRPLSAFSDAFSTPILMNDLVELMLDLVNDGATGIFHLAGRDRVSRYDFALKLAEMFHCPRSNIRPISLEDLPLKAQRSKDMSLCSKKAEKHLGSRVPALESGLQRLKDLRAAGFQATLENAVKN